MKRTTPLLMTVVGLCAVLLALSMFWLALLPVQLTSALKAEVEERTGLRVKATGSSFSFWQGLSLQLDNVNLTKNDEQSVPTASIEHLSAGLSLSNLFGGKLRLENISLDNPVINIKTDTATQSVADVGVAVPAITNEKSYKDVTVTLHNGTVKWSDAGRQVFLAVSDLNGTLTTEQDGSAKLDLAGLFNGKLTRLAATVDDVRRLKNDGSPSDVTLSAGQNSLSFSGRTKMHDGMQMDGRITASSDSLRDMAAWLGLQLAGFAETGRFNAESSASWNGARLDLKQLAITLGQSNVTGSATLDLKQAKPLFDAKLDADRLDLSIYNKVSSVAEQPATPAIAAPWNESAMNFADLKALDSKITITTTKLVVAGLETGSTTMDLQVNDGAVAMTLASDEVAGGKAKAELSIVQNETMPDVTLKIDAQNVAARAFLQPLTGFSALDGPMSLKADLTSQGNSTARLVSSLGGTAEIALKNGSISGLALAEFLSGKGKGWRMASDKTTAVTSGDASFEIQDGVAQLASASVETTGLKVVATGEIDLLRQSIDLICKPEVAGSVKLPVRLALSGPWVEPNIDTDIDPAKLKPKALIKTGKKAIKKLFGN